jgi:hypothetical protein
VIENTRIQYQECTGCEKEGSVYCLRLRHVVALTEDGLFVSIIDLSIFSLLDVEDIA